MMNGLKLDNVPRPGDLITCVLRKDDEAVLLGTKILEVRSTLVGWSLKALNIVQEVLQATEGSLWVRGWYSEHTDEGKALLAACALADEGRLAAIGVTGVVGPKGPFIGSGTLVGSGTGTGTVTISGRGGWIQEHKETWDELMNSMRGGRGSK